MLDTSRIIVQNRNLRVSIMFMRLNVCLLPIEVLEVSLLNISFDGWSLISFFQSISAQI